MNFLNLTTAVEDAAALRAQGKLDDAVALMKRACAADPKDASMKDALRELLREQLARLKDPRRSTDPSARRMNSAQITAAAMLFLSKPQFQAMPESKSAWRPQYASLASEKRVLTAIYQILQPACVGCSLRLP